MKKSLATKISLQQTFIYKINGKLKTGTSNATFVTNDLKPLNEVKFPDLAISPDDLTTLPQPIPQFLTTIASIFEKPTIDSKYETESIDGSETVNKSPQILEDNLPTEIEPSEISTGAATDDDGEHGDDNRTEE